MARYRRAWLATTAVLLVAVLSVGGVPQPTVGLFGDVEEAGVSVSVDVNLGGLTEVNPQNEPADPDTAEVGGTNVEGSSTVTTNASNGTTAAVNTTSVSNTTATVTTNIPTDTPTDTPTGTPKPGTPLSTTESG
jgi:hypothetical protein